jgi:hypothetical protein
MLPAMPFDRVNPIQLTRRALLGRTATGIGSLALASLLNDNARAAAVSTIDAARAHLAPKAKRIIFLFMSGGPSQIDLFDPKPKLNQLSGEPMPESFTKGERVAQLQGQKLVCVGSRFRFAKFGQAGVDVSELLPYTARIVDDITVIRSMKTEAINHDPAVTFFQTGNSLPGRPTMGAWLSYGLGSENRDLPSFVVLVSGIGQGQNLHTRYWESGFLPSVHQGVQFRSQGDPVLYLSNPAGMDNKTRRRILDGIRSVNAAKHETVGDPEIATRIEQYEMAYRMQTSVPELMNTAEEPQSTLDLYGRDVQKPGTFAANCLLARRLAERDVRFIQLYHRDWDNHGNLPNDLKMVCDQTDRGAAALIQDLKQRGLLDDTIVIWSGEFGRTPMAQGSSMADSYGRDHHMKAFTCWVAGGGFKAGALVGQTDEFGYDSIADPIHVHDLHATVLHQLGIDHTRLTYRFQGRDYRLTDVAGNVSGKLLS